MKIVFMGTPDFAVPSLIKLKESGHDIVGVFTQPDKKKGRGYEMSESPVKTAAINYNLKVYQPTTLKKEESFNILKDLDPDLIIVVAYGKILPKNILELPKFGCINVHGSLLPEYRGAAPIQWAVLDGKSRTGITTMYMDEGLDTGDILLKAETNIGENETSAELYDRLSKLGAELLIETISKLINYEIKPEKQDNNKATYSKMLTKEMANIDWTKSANEIHNLVRGLNPWPIAMTTIDGKNLKIYKTSLINKISNNPGEILSEQPFLVSCGNNTVIKIDEVQLVNKKRMKSEDFLRGYKIKNKMLGQ